MDKRWKRMAGAIVAAISLVGCSYISTKVQPEDWLPPPPAPPAEAERVIRPGPGPVLVEAVRRSSARIAWRSPWRGETVVFFGPSPDLAQADATPPTGATRVDLSGLKPRTRYFFRVVTRTPEGVARSSVLSFMTR